MYKIIFLVVILCVHDVACFWDAGTTTLPPKRDKDTPRQSFFRWQWVFFTWFKVFFPYDWDDIDRRQRLCMIGGISIDHTCLTTGALLNHRTVLTAYNPLRPYRTRQKDVRVWALGRGGLHNTPYRYRAHHFSPIEPVSGRPEHCHGHRCTHHPRHDLCVITTMDKMYLYYIWPNAKHYAHRAFLTETRSTIQLNEDLWFGGSGFEYMEHIKENYKIFYAMLRYDDIVDCSKYLPKWWGKFICIRNWKGLAGVQNGASLFTGHTVVGIGCFEIRMNDDKIFVFTDLRYYATYVRYYGQTGRGAYYEYAFPQWGINKGWLWDSWWNDPQIPYFQTDYQMII